MRPVRLIALCACAGALAGLTAASSGAAPGPIRLTVRPLTKDLSTTRFAKSTITVKNTGHESLRGLSLWVGSVNGVEVMLGHGEKVKRKRSLAPMAPGRSRSAAVSLRRTGAGPTSGSLVIKVRRGGRTLASGRLTFGATPTEAPPSGPPAPPAAGPPIAGREFSTPVPFEGHYLYKVYRFFPSGFAYVGVPREPTPECQSGLPAGMQHVPSDFERWYGFCVAYSYDPVSGRLTTSDYQFTSAEEIVIFGRTGHLDGSTLTLDPVADPPLPAETYSGD